MTYEEFLEKMKQRVQEEFGIQPEDIKYCPEGFTSDDPVLAEWIKDSNLRFMDSLIVKIFDRKDRMAYAYAETAKESGKMGEMLSGKPYLCDEKEICPGLIGKVL